MRSNRDVGTVERILLTAKREADLALDADPRWVRLVSAIIEMRGALEHDDPGERPIAIGIIRDVCAEAEVRL